MADPLLQLMSQPYVVSEGSADAPSTLFVQAQAVGDEKLSFHSFIVQIEDFSGVKVWEDEALRHSLESLEQSTYEKEMPPLEDGAYRIKAFLYAEDNLAEESEYVDFSVVGGKAYEEESVPDGVAVFKEMPEVIDDTIVYSVQNIGAEAIEPHKEAVRLQHRLSGWSWTSRQDYESLAPSAIEPRQFAIPDEAPDGHIEGFVILNDDQQAPFDFDKGDASAAADPVDPAAAADDPWAGGVIDVGEIEIDVSPDTTADPTPVAVGADGSAEDDPWA